MLYDQGNDGAVCPIDLQIFMVLFTKKFSYMLWSDVELINEKIHKSI